SLRAAESHHVSRLTAGLAVLTISDSSLGGGHPLAALPSSRALGEERFDPLPEVFAHVGLYQQVRTPVRRRHLNADTAERLLSRLQRERCICGEGGADLHDPRLQRLFG